MSVEFEPKDPCFCFGVSNGTWFTLLKNTDIGKVLPSVNTNDPITATKEQALECASILGKWTPPGGWYCSGREVEGKHMFIEFFKDCGGFTTS